ncbi:MAG: helix-turn-helix domain-containing protein [Acidimicrobiales bacterium]
MARARLEARLTSGGGDDQRPAANDAVVTIGPVESERPLWYAGPDLAAAIAACRVRDAGGTPTVIRAWRLRPAGKLDTLTPSRFRGADLIDPRTDDFFQRLIELRKAKTGDPLDDERRSTGYEVVANSGAYGIFSETSPIDIDPDDQARKPRRVAVYADTSFATEVDRPERHGRMNFFPTASLVTAGARLMLALGMYLVERAGGEVAYCDTDSLVVVAAKDGGLVPCEGGPYVLRDGARAVRALSWKAVEAIRERFQSLNPYDTPVGDVLKLEDENFTDGTREERCNLWCYAVSEKSYALFTLDERGEPVIRKYSSHVLGQYRSPMEGDRHGWISDAWKREIRAAHGKPVEPFAWEQYPAIAPLTLSTWSVLKPYRDNARVHPFDFLAVALMSRNLVDIAAHPRVCCKDPRPACTLFPSAVDWKAQDWRCLRCGTPWDFDAFPRFQTYGDIVRATLQSFERKRLRADGSEPTGATMRGLTIPRPVRVESKGTIGKEVIVDPTDTDEGLTAEQLSATSVVQYRDPGERLDALRAKIKAVGIKPLARTTGVSRRLIQAFANQGKTPHVSTLEKLEAAGPARATTRETSIQRRP